ncbi:MAG: helix-turn-helix transcriptional regulator [Planctomycetes bacterium]|nr:helix-turn-helix transcriptional regulator [Planctomycetota bacterium]
MKPFKTFYADPPIETPELSIHALGVGEWMAPCIIDRPSGTGDYLFMHFHHETTLGTPHGPQAFPANTLMVWAPEHGHYYGRLASRWCHSWMHCDGSAVGRMLDAAAVPLATPITGVDPAIIESSVAAMHDEIQRHARADVLIVESQVQILARELGRIARSRIPSAAVPRRWLDLRRHLEESVGEAVRLRDLAKRAGCSVPHFCSEFKRHFGTSAIDFAIRSRMHRAAILLRDRNLSVTSIAGQVGYEDIHHFSKLFKKHHGCAPRTLRQRWLAEA